MARLNERAPDRCAAGNGAHPPSVKTRRPVPGEIFDANHTPRARRARAAGGSRGEGHDAAGKGGRGGFCRRGRGLWADRPGVPRAGKGDSGGTAPVAFDAGGPTSCYPPPRHPVRRSLAPRGGPRAAPHSTPSSDGRRLRASSEWTTATALPARVSHPKHEPPMHVVCGCEVLVMAWRCYAEPLLEHSRPGAPRFHAETPRRRRVGKRSPRPLGMQRASVRSRQSASMRRTRSADAFVPRASKAGARRRRAS
jgi:hypothetical protein